MVDRRFVYTGQIPLDTDILIPQKNTMIGIGQLAQAVIGQQGVTAAFAADGFAITATLPVASLVMNIGPGSVYAQGVVDQTNYGSVPADVTDIITLQGIILPITPLTFTPPGTGGFATNYLVQVSISNIDGSPVVLNYVNANNPLSLTPWSGPNNTGGSQNTVRQCTVSISAKAGVPAAAGSQTTPAPDAGFFGLWVVTVANGATQLTSSQVALYPNAPFIPASLCGMPQAFQSNKWTFAADTGTANALVASLSPAPLNVVTGMSVTIKKGANANTGPASFNLNGAGAVGIRTSGGVVLAGGEMPANAMLGLRFDGTFWQLANTALASFGGPLFSGSTTGTNTYTVSNLSPAAGGLTNGMVLICNFGNPNTTNSTVNIGFGPSPIVYTTGSPLVGGELTGQEMLVYSVALGSWELLTPTLATPATQPSFVHAGADTSITANAITVPALTPPISGYTAGHMYIVTAVANTNSAGMTANFNGIGTRVVAHEDGTSMGPGEVQAGQTLVLADNGAQLVCPFKVPPSVQQVLTAPQTYYVSTLGNDLNNGTSPGTAFATLQRALHTSSTFNLNGFNITINVANGTYTSASSILLPFINGAGTVFVVGNASSPASCILSCSGGSAILASGTLHYSFSGFQLQNLGSPPAGEPGACFYADSGGNTILSNIVFGPCFTAYCIATNAANITLTGTIGMNGAVSNSGRGQSAIAAYAAQINTPPGASPSITITGVPTLGAFVSASIGAQVSVNYSSLTGTITGLRYSVGANSTINTNGGGVNYYPGSGSSIQQNGQYL